MKPFRSCLFSRESIVDKNREADADADAYVMIDVMIDVILDA